MTRMTYGGEKWNVFSWLDRIRDRPSIYFRNNSLKELETLVAGYYAALSVHGIVESVPQMGRHFLYWLHYKTAWSCCAGWSNAIERRHPNPENALTVFFTFVDKYRRLRPVRLCSVRLGPAHNPTGKRVCIGLDGRMPKPRQVDVIRYRPEPLHFLRFYYRDRVVDDDLLMTGSGKFRTTVRFAKRWVREELQVELNAWEAAARVRA